MRRASVFVMNQLTNRNPNSSNVANREVDSGANVSEDDERVVFSVGLIRVLSIGYLALVRTTLELLKCITIGSR